ncbi:MAG: hypothetical protein HRU03_08675 [Nanoarchaeales archaeon]|nr:hypothetical protein [Nanoarchaeales archaeon]
MSFNLEFKPSFLDSIKFLDKTFLDLINNRLNHLKENPFKYSSNFILSRNIYSLRVSNTSYDMKLIFKIKDNSIYLFGLYNLEENIETIRKLFK